MGTALRARASRGGMVEPRDIAVVELDAGRRGALAGELPGVRVSGEVTPADGVIVAVKPDAAEAACRAVGGAGPGRVLSIMAGVSLARLESWLAPATAVVRAMPNTPAMVGAGVAAIAPGSAADEPAMAWAEEILGAVGHVVRVPEPALDAVTGLSGSGPAYVFLVVEALAEAGVAVGLAPEVSLRLATGTLAGAARLLVESGEPPEMLRAQVTSPGWHDRGRTAGARGTGGACGGHRGGGRRHRRGLANWGSDRRLGAARRARVGARRGCPDGAAGASGTGRPG